MFLRRREENNLRIWSKIHQWSRHLFIDTIDDWIHLSEQRIVVPFGNGQKKARISFVRKPEMSEIFEKYWPGQVGSLIR